MPLACTRCEGTGFLNTEQLLFDMFDLDDPEEGVLLWIKNNKDHDVQVCDCCGNGEDGWCGIVGEHYNSEDPSGRGGPYEYNGGLCECH